MPSHEGIVANGHIRPAEPGRGNPDQGLVGLGSGNFHFLNHTFGPLIDLYHSLHFLPS
jgi:hypothetical protein